MKLPKPNNRRDVMAWCIYDWANSGYTTLLITVFVVYIQKVIFVEDAKMGAVVWAWSIGVSMLIGAILSPFAGAVADAYRNYGGKRIGLMTSAIGGGVCCVLMGLAPVSSPWMVIGFLILANLGLELSLTFYNGFLPEIAEESDMNRISSTGFAVGYFGGGLALLAAVLFLHFNQELETVLRLRICIVGAGIWWILFTIPVVLILKDKICVRKNYESETLNTNQGYQGLFGICQQSVKDTLETLREIRLVPAMFWFLIAFLIYNDGVQTVISQASTFALQELHFTDTGLVAVVLLIQFVATPGAVLTGWVADKTSRKAALVLCLSIWIILLISAWFVTAKWHFWVLAVGVALVLGGTQSVSRAIMGSLIPPGKEARYFGFFNLSGKATSFLGTFFFGAVVALTGSPRLAIVGLLLFFAVGLIIFLKP